MKRVRQLVQSAGPYLAAVVVLLLLAAQVWPRRLTWFCMT